MRACTARDVPCHRVIAAGGRLGGYGGSPQLKRALLKAEGIVVAGERIREFQQKRWIRYARHGRAPPERSGALGSPRATEMGVRRGEAPRFS